MERDRRRGRPLFEGEREKLLLDRILRYTAS